MSSAPFVRGSETSRAAADSVVDEVRSMKETIYDLMAAAGAHGMTCSQVEQIMTHRQHQSISARIRGLVLDGRIADSGRKRPGASGRNQRVYVVASESPQGALFAPDELS